MNNPQTIAKELKKYIDHIANIADFSCLAMCYLFCAGIETDDINYIISVARAIEEGYLDKECTVLDASKFLNAFTGRKTTVIKKNITDIATIKERTPVRYTYNGAGHWVVVENGRIVFNSLLNSLCVTKGKPTEARIIKWV